MKRYFSFNNFLQNLIGSRVYKISLDGNFTCPNRDGTKSFEGCIYCDKYGSSSRTHKQKTSIKEQVLKNIEIRKSRYKAKKFIAYFQSFTNTYKSVDQLKILYDEAIFSHPDIIGLSISTRPDSIDEEKIKLIASYKKFLPFVSIELGMQTMHDETLQLINRHETHKDFLKAFHMIKKHDIHVCSHVILGLPNENKKNMLDTAKCLSKLDIGGIKLHMLIVLKNTKLEQLYNKDLWTPLTFDEYVNITTDFIEILPKKTIIHRISGSGYPTDIIAPKWVYDKKIEIMRSIEKELENRDTYQGFKVISV